MGNSYHYERYKPQLCKTLEGMQKWVLHKRHDFGFESLIGDEIINVINRECADFESKSDIERVYPGQLVWEREIELSLPDRWCDDSRYELVKRKIIISRYTQSMLRSIVSERIPVHQASLSQLKEIVREFLAQGYYPDIDDIIAIGGVRSWIAEEILLSCEDSMLVTPRKKKKVPFNILKLKERLIGKLSKIISRKPRELELIVSDLLSVRNEIAPTVDKLSHGEMVGISLSKYQKKLYRRSMNELKKTVDKVCYITKSEEEYLKNGGIPSDIREQQIVRISKDNYKKCNGVYSLSDICLKFGLSEGHVGRIIKGYEERTGITIPRSGTIFDAGPTQTHKSIIINLLEDGYDLNVIKDRTCHTEEAILRYSKRYEIVRELADKKTVLEITQRTGISIREVNAYLEILIKRYPDFRIREYETSVDYDQQDYERLEALFSLFGKKITVSYDLLVKITDIPKLRIKNVLDKLEKKFDDAIIIS